MAKQISTARKVGRVIKSIVKVVVGLLMVAIMAVLNFVVPSMGMITRMGNNMLGYQQSWKAPAGAEDVDAQYYKSDFTAEEIADAEHALTSAGLQARYTGDPAGIVVAQDIAAGTMVAQGTMVTVMLSGRQEMVTVPKLVGLTVTSAEIETDKLGLALKVEEGGLHGTVTDQWPEEGTQVPQRTTIHIVVDDSAYK